MLRFIREAGIYLPQHDAVAFTALEDRTVIACRAQRSAFVALGGEVGATPTDLLTMFDSQRPRLEQIVRSKWDRALFARNPDGQPQVIVEWPDVALLRAMPVGPATRPLPVIESDAPAAAMEQLAEKPLRILVVEDNRLCADAIRDALEEHGCEVRGPAPDLDSALDLVAKGGIDGAILDIRLGGRLCFPIAAALAERGIPFVFLTGYDRPAVPPEFRAVRRLSKPGAIAEISEIAVHLFDKPSRRLH